MRADGWRTSCAFLARKVVVGGKSVCASCQGACTAGPVVRHDRLPSSCAAKVVLRNIRFQGVDSADAGALAVDMVCSRAFVLAECRWW